MADASLRDARRRASFARPIGAGLFVALQHLLPQHTLSRLVHRLARSRRTLLKNALIRTFVRGYRPRLEEAAEPDPLRYASFNDFFTRALRSGVRPIEAAASTVASPVDGAVSQIGELDELTLIQAKGRHYQLGALLGSEAAEWTRRLAGGAYATLYLAPYDYHRIHMPLGARLRAAWYIPGRLFSVNAVTAAAVTGLFTRNERVVCAFETDGGMPFAMVLVGALFVGSISTRWHGDVTPSSLRHVLGLPVPEGARLERGAEMGRFNMGSTVILLFPPESVVWRTELVPGSRVEVGRVLARLATAP